MGGRGERGVELGQTVTSGVSSFNEGTALFTVAMAPLICSASQFPT